jgi:hypothetical protein
MCLCETGQKDFWNDCEDCYISRLEEAGRPMNVRTYRVRSFSTAEVLTDWLRAMCVELGVRVPKPAKPDTTLEELSWADRTARVTDLLRQAGRMTVGELREAKSS